MTMARRLIPILVVALLALVPAGARAYLPPGFVGVSPQNGGTAKDYRLMREAGVYSVRMPLNWSAVEPENPAFSERDWEAFDHEVRLAAREGIEIFPFIASSPGGCASQGIDLPVANPWQRRAWASFLRAAVRRYGPEGSFWREEAEAEELPYLPMKRWEIWNEENIVSFADQPRTEALRDADPDRRPGDPQRSPRLEGDRRRSLRPAAADPAQRRLRRLPLAALPRPAREAVFRRRRPAPLRRRRAGDGGAADQPAADHAPPRRRRHAALRDRAGLGLGERPDPLAARPLGAGRTSSPKPSRCSPPTACAGESRGAWWFTWSDEGGSCVFCHSAGLLTTKREAKPAWYRFNEWTGGTPGRCRGSAARISNRSKKPKSHRREKPPGRNS